MIDIKKMLEETAAVASGHFVYKKRNMHGAGYIDKDRFPLIGASNLVEILHATAEKALESGLDLTGYKEVGLLTPAYGAIKLGLPVADHLERRTGTKVIVIETEVPTKEGKRVHIIPENQAKMVYGLPIIGVDDITNNGETFKELKPLTASVLESEIFAVLSIIDRGGQTKESLGLRGYYPYMRIDMSQHDCKGGLCDQCLAGVPINTVLGKGKEWVAMFGQPPYPPDMDFSAIWAKD